MAKRLRSVDKEEYWRWHVDLQVADGLSVKTYCRAHGLSVPSFYAWRRELQRRDAGRDIPQRVANPSVTRHSGPVRSKAAPRQSSVRLQSSGDVGLVALEIIATSGATENATLEIETSGGVVIRLREEVSTDVLRRVIEACQQSHAVRRDEDREVRSC